MFSIKGLRRRITAKWTNENGAATFEFVILFPVIIAIFLTGFEAGYYLLRSVMLDRAVDLAAREVRLGNEAADDYASLKSLICNQTLVIPNCTEKLQMELRPVTAEGVASLGTVTKCIDTRSNADPAEHTLFKTGAGNQWMVLRVCALSKPLFPTTMLASGMAADGEGNYAVVSKSGWVNEPEDATIGEPEGTVDIIEEQTPPNDPPEEDPVDDEEDTEVVISDPVVEEPPLVIPEVPVLEAQG